MAAKSLSIKLSDTTIVTKTLTVEDFSGAVQEVLQMTRGGGFLDDSNVFHPATAVVSVTIT